MKGRKILHSSIPPLFHSVISMHAMSTSKVDMQDNHLRQDETATLAGGCFWCLEAAFQELEGVASVESGYTGGHAADPSYRQVCSGATGHAEAVQVVYDPDVISFRDLLEVFFTIHNPTTLNREGADVGTQYRSAIFYHGDDQRETAEQLIEELEAEGIYDGIVTEVEPLGSFYPAEEKHRNYYRNNPDRAYCRSVIDPKLSKLRREHRERLRA